MPEWLTFVTLALASLVVATWAHLVFWGRFFHVPAEYAEEHTLTLGDGGVVALRRLGEASGPPVVLLHGIAANHRNVDPFPHRSLARTLADDGRDVWLLTLRMGHRRQPAPADLDGMVMVDLPQALAFVRERRGESSTPVDLVGFSLGGLVVIAALAYRFVRVDQVGRVVCIGAPALIGGPPLRLPLAPLLGPLRFVFRALPTWALPRVPARLLARAFASTLGYLRTPWHRWVVNPRLLERGELPRAMVSLVEDVPAALHRQLHRIWRSGGRVALLGRDLLEAIEYAEPLPPALFVVGGADQVVGAESSRAGFEAWGANGDWREVPELGHADLMLSREAPGKVFAVVSAFLAAGDERSQD